MIRVERYIAKMTNNNQKGFSIIELLIVVVIIGVVAALAVPALQKGIRAAENGNTHATLRTIFTTEMNFYSNRGRYGRLIEINNLMNGAIGTNSVNDVIRNNFTLSMTPAVPTDLELRDGYTIVASRTIPGENVTYFYEVTQNGEIRQWMLP